MNDGQITESFNTLGNAVELATMIISKVAGDIVSSNLGGQPATAGVLSQTIAAKMQQNIKIEGGAVQ